MIFISLPVDYAKQFYIHPVTLFDYFKKEIGKNSPLMKFSALLCNILDNTAAEEEQEEDGHRTLQIAYI